MLHLPPMQMESHQFEAANEPGRHAICDRLVAAGKLDADHVERALKLQREQDSWEMIGQILVKLGLTTETDLAECLAEQLEVRFVSQDEYREYNSDNQRISPRFLETHRIFVLDEDNDSVTLVMAEPQDEYARHAIALCCGKEVVPCLGIPSEIENHLNRQPESAARQTGPGSDDQPSAAFLDDVEQLRELAGEAPIIKLVNQLIRKAAESGASDIHIEPFEGQLKIRYRIDGILREMNAPPVHSAAAVISRVKIMADLNIAERRLSQDGRFRRRVGGSEYDVRVSTAPTMHGESVVLRLLRRDGVLMDFRQLGFSDTQTRAVHDILAMPHGILLVTGPTGSGKSTTLYTALRHLNTPERMIITVEDPVEYHIHGINQMQVKPQIGLTFASALRSIVRQDPDIIMIGEMRDSETAEIAVQSALTGHLVLSTLHTNDAPGSIHRLLDMGVQDYLLTSAVNAVIAQRLVRTLCRCRQSYEPIAALVDRFDLERFAKDGHVRLYRAVGCDQCDGTGFIGRSAILEILPISDDIKPLVMQRADVSEIRAVAAAHGMCTMLDDGLGKAAAGKTTIEEVVRVAPTTVTRT